MPLAISYEDEVQIVLSYLSGRRLRASHLSGLWTDGLGYVTDLGAREIIVELSGEAMRKVDAVIKKSRAVDRNFEEGSWEDKLARALRVDRADTEARLGEYRRLTAPARG